jgi:hypothetical protein
MALTSLHQQTCATILGAQNSPITQTTAMWSNQVNHHGEPWQTPAYITKQSNDVIQEQETPPVQLPSTLSLMLWARLTKLNALISSPLSIWTGKERWAHFPGDSLVSATRPLSFQIQTCSPSSNDQSVNRKNYHLVKWSKDLKTEHNWEKAYNIRWKTSLGKAPLNFHCMHQDLLQFRSDHKTNQYSEGT